MWYDKLLTDSTIKITMNDWPAEPVLKIMAEQSLKENNTLFYSSFSGQISEEHLKELHQILKKENFFNFYEQWFSQYYYKQFLLKKESPGYILLSVEAQHNDHAAITAVFSNDNDEQHQNIKKEFKTRIKSLSIAIEDDRGTVYMLGSTQVGYQLFELGCAGITLEKINYPENVIKDYEEIRDQLESSTPQGRLVILNGEPGTGKTYLVRSLLKDVKKSVFVFIPPHLVSHLVDPNFIPTLLQLVKDEGSVNITLVVEDADLILLKRAGDNMPSISSILNFTSGIVGDMLNVKIVATTNAKRLDLDHAVLRDGRLLKHVEIGPLTPEKCKEVYKNLTGEEKDFKTSLILGSVYKQAYDNGWRPPANSQHKVKLKSLDRQEVTAVKGSPIEL